MSATKTKKELEIEALTKLRDEYLESHPHLRTFQDELDIATESLSPMERLGYFAAHIQNNMNIIKHSVADAFKLINQKDS